MSESQRTQTESAPAYRRSLLLAATTLILGILFPLVLAEIGLRLFWEGYYEKDSEPRYQRDEILGWSPVPDFDGIHGSAEFKVRVTHDSRGVRGGAVGTDRVADASRIVFIGDSMTYGHAVSDEEAFVGILHHRDNGIETVNLGVGGYNTGQQLLRLKHQGFDYSPDLVVMDVFWNDLYWENLESPGPRFEVQDGELVQFGFALEDMDSELIFQREADEDGWLEGTHVYRLVSDSIKLFRARFRDNFSRRFKEGDEAKEAKAWEVFRALVMETARLCREKRTPFLVVLIPDQVEVETDKQVLGLPPRFEQLLPRLEAFLAEEGIDCFSPLAGLRAHYERHRRPLYFHMNRHMTPEGNQVLADILEPVLKARLQSSNLEETRRLIDFRDWDELMDRRPVLIAHRGGVISPTAPEGSLSAIRLAALDGYDMVELDIQPTADDHPVVFHDMTLEEDTDRTGRISDLTREEATSIPFKGLEETIPSLEAALELCAELGLGVMLDFKTDGSETYYRRVLDGLEAQGLLQSTITISSRPSVREFFKDKIWLRILEQGPLAEGRYAFDRASAFDAETIADLKSQGLLVVPALNTFHYPRESHMEEAGRDARRLLEEGADGFQIDSVYQHFFGLRER